MWRVTVFAGAASSIGGTHGNAEPAPAATLIGILEPPADGAQRLIPFFATRVVTN